MCDCGFTTIKLPTSSYIGIQDTTSTGSIFIILALIFAFIIFTILVIGLLPKPTQITIPIIRNNTFQENKITPLSQEKVEDRK